MGALCSSMSPAVQESLYNKGFKYSRSLIFNCQAIIERSRWVKTNMKKGQGGQGGEEK